MSWTRLYGQTRRLILCATGVKGIRGKLCSTCIIEAGLVKRTSHNNEGTFPLCMHTLESLLPYA